MTKILIQFYLNKIGMKSTWLPFLPSDGEGNRNVVQMRRLNKGQTSLKLCSIPSCCIKMGFSGLGDSCNYFTIAPLQFPLLYSPTSFSSFWTFPASRFAVSSALLVQSLSFPFL